MKLKRTKLPAHHTAATQGEPSVVFIKEPKLFCQAISLGGEIEVDDQLGYAILAKYTAEFEKVEIRQKVLKDMETK